MPNVRATSRAANRLGPMILKVKAGWHRIVGDSKKNAGNLGTVHGLTAIRQPGAVFHPIESTHNPIIMTKKAAYTRRNSARAKRHRLKRPATPERIEANLPLIAYPDQFVYSAVT